MGATGSGKSTLVDGFVNYFMGVSFDDPFRFTIAMLEHEEMKTYNQVNTFTCIFSLSIHIYSPCIQKQTLVIQRFTTYNLCTYEKYIAISHAYKLLHTQMNTHTQKTHTIFIPQFYIKKILC